MATVTVPDPPASEGADEKPRPTSDDPLAPFGHNDDGTALAPYGVKADGTPYRRDFSRKGPPNAGRRSRPKSAIAQVSPSPLPPATALRGNAMTAAAHTITARYPALPPVSNLYEETVEGLRHRVEEARVQVDEAQVTLDRFSAALEALESAQ